MLKVTDLHAYYGKSHILQGVTMNVEEGEIVALLGRNGVGRSTTCKAVMGAVEPVGSVMFKGQEIAGRKPFEIKVLRKTTKLEKMMKGRTHVTTNWVFLVVITFWEGIVAWVLLFIRNECSNRTHPK